MLRCPPKKMSLFSEDQGMLHRRRMDCNTISFLVGSRFLHVFAPNKFAGTAILAQAGIWILVTLVWASVFIADQFIFFSYHPVSSYTLMSMHSPHTRLPERVMPMFAIGR